jgi:hypothetical protein
MPISFTRHRGLWSPSCFIHHPCLCINVCTICLHLSIYVSLRVCICAYISDSYALKLATHVARKDAEVRTICHAHYEEFIACIDSLVTVKVWVGYSRISGVDWVIGDDLDGRVAGMRSGRYGICGCSCFVCEGVSLSLFLSLSLTLSLSLSIYLLPYAIYHVLSFCS